MFKRVDVPVMWSLDQAKVETGLSKFTLMQAIKQGHIKFIRLGAGQRGKILLNAESLCGYMAGVPLTDYKER